MELFDNVTDSLKECIADTLVLRSYCKLNFKSLDKKYREAQEYYKNGLIIYDALTKLESSNLPDSTLEIGESTFSLKKTDGTITIIPVNSPNEQDNTQAELLSDESSNPLLAIATLKTIERRRTIIINSTLSYLITIYENFLAEILRLAITREPDKYFSDKKIEVMKVISGNLESLTNELVSREIETRIYDSIREIKNLRDSLLPELSVHNELISDFEQAYYVRNIYIHNRGRANDKFLSAVASRNDLKVGDKVPCDCSFLVQSVENLVLLISVLYLETAKKYAEQTKKVLSDFAQEFAFVFLCKGDYSIAEYLYKSLAKYNKFEFVDKAMFQVNYLNACKQQGKDIDGELAKLDFSIATDNFRIAKLCLENKHEETYQQLRATFPNSFTAPQVREWPLFIDFRNTDLYKKFADEHKEEFAALDIDAKDLRMAGSDSSIDSKE